MAVEGGPFILFPGGPQVQRYATAHDTKLHLKTFVGQVEFGFAQFGPFIT